MYEVNIQKIIDDYFPYYREIKHARYDSSTVVVYVEVVWAVNSYILYIDIYNENA